MDLNMYTKMIDLLNSNDYIKIQHDIKKYYTFWAIFTHDTFLESNPVSKIPGSFWGQELEEGSWGFGQEFGGSPGPEASSRGGWVSGGAPLQFHVMKNITYHKFHYIYQII